VIARLLLAAALALGCSHAHPRAVPAPDALEKPILVPEPIAGDVVELIDELTGFRMGAMTPPGFPPIVFDHSGDACVIAHEVRHEEQQARDGELRWSARYARDFLACWLPGRRRDDFARCYHGVPYELDAMAVQTKCMLDRAEGKGPV
jgi:hypothetical protein